MELLDGIDRTARYIFKVCKATALSIGTPEVPAKFGSKRSTLGPTLKNESCGMGLSMGSFHAVIIVRCLIWRQIFFPRENQSCGRIPYD